MDSSSGTTPRTALALQDSQTYAGPEGPSAQPGTEVVGMDHGHIRNLPVNVHLSFISEHCFGPQKRT